MCLGILDEPEMKRYPQNGGCMSAVGPSGHRPLLAGSTFFLRAFSASGGGR